MIRNAVVIAGTPPAFAAKQGIVRRFLVWAQQAGADERASAANTLARAFLHSNLPPLLKAEVVVAMTALIDDPSADVRRAMAEALAGSNDAPRHLVVALTNDQSDVAAPLLERSPLIGDAELADRVAGGDAAAQCAVARRPRLGAAPSAALAKYGKREAALALLGNVDADLTPALLGQIFKRFGDEADARNALLARPDLPASLRAEIAIAAAKAVSDFSVATGWLDEGRAARIARDTVDATIIAISANCEREERAELARTLRERGMLNMALLLRSLLSDEPEFAAAALAELSGVNHSRAAGFLREPLGQGFAAMARKAGLPPPASIVFRCALSGIGVQGGGSYPELKLHLVQAAIAACAACCDSALDPTLSLLWRFAAETARADARSTARGMASRPPSLNFAPANDERSAPLLARLSDAKREHAPLPLNGAVLAATGHDANLQPYWTHPDNRNGLGRVATTRPAALA